MTTPRGTFAQYTANATPVRQRERKSDGREEDSASDKSHDPHGAIFVALQEGGPGSRSEHQVGSVWTAKYEISSVSGSGDALVSGKFEPSPTPSAPWGGD